MTGPRPSETFGEYVERTRFAWLDRLLLFANADLPLQPTRADAEDLRSAILKIDADVFLPGGAMLTMLDIEFAAGELRSAQTALRNHLDEIISEHGATVVLVHEIGDALRAIQRDGLVSGVATLNWRPNARRRKRFEFASYAVLRPRTVQQWITLALAALVSMSNPTLAHKIGRCGLSSCGIYFARPKARGDSPLQWCCPSHGSQHRTKISRQGKAKQKVRRRKSS